MAQCKEDLEWTGLEGSGFAAIMRVRTRQPLLDQIPNVRFLNFWGFGDLIGYAGRKE